MSFADLVAYILGDDLTEHLDPTDIRAVLWEYTPWPFGDFTTAYRALTVALHSDPE